jgi:hypothetical protein
LIFIYVWLSERIYFVNISGKCSSYLNLESGTIQGSILGPFLCAIYVSLLFDLTKITSFADDNQVVKWKKCLSTLEEEITTSLGMIIKWLKDLGLKVNHNKTEICTFHKNLNVKTCVNADGVLVNTSDSINVLGVEFDSWIQWCKQVSNTIKRAYKSLHALKLIKKFFTKKELNMLIIPNLFVSCIIF